MWAQSGMYAVLVVALEKMAALSGDASLRAHAQRIADGVWGSRFNQRVWLVPDTVTTHGPLPGDQEGPPLRRYMIDSDSLYFSNAMYDAYAAAGGQYRPGLAPTTPPHWR